MLILILLLAILFFAPYAAVVYVLSIVNNGVIFPAAAAGS